jgi:hypothetical protein
MLSGRRSKRLAGDPPGAKPSTKRRTKPNTHTLAEFSKEQRPIRPALPRKRSSRKGSTSIASMPSRETTQARSIEISSTLALTFRSSSPVLDSSPVRPRKKATPIGPPSPFDPTVRGKDPHHVQIYITPVIDRVRKDKNSFLRHININDILYPTLKELQGYVYEKYVNRYAELRQLKPAERLVLSRWKVVIRNPRGVH